MDTRNFAENLLDKIKSENIAPKPRWHFLLKNYIVWIFGALALIIGSLAMSVIIYLLKYNDWEGGIRANDSFWSFFLITLPYFWIIFLGLFVLVLYYNIKHSKKGYRYPASFIIVFAILASIILGELFFLFGFGHKIDDILGRKAPLYAQMFNPQLEFWCQPEEGRLAGVAVINEGKMTIVDPFGEIWEIATTSETIERAEFMPGEVINLIGELSNDGVFIAEFVKSPRSGRAFMQRPGHASGQGACLQGASCEFINNKLQDKRIPKELRN